MTRLYGVLSQACGALAVALLAVAVMTATTRQAFADEEEGPEGSQCLHLQGDAYSDCLHRLQCISQTPSCVAQAIAIPPCDSNTCDTTNFSCWCYGQYVATSRCNI